MCEQGRHWLYEIWYPVYHSKIFHGVKWGGWGLQGKTYLSGRVKRRKKSRIFLLNNKKALLTEAAINRDSASVTAYINAGIFDSKEAADEAADFFCEKDFAEGVNIMIDYRNKNFKKTSIMDMEI